MKTKFLALLLIAAAILDAYADTWTDPETGYTWMYRISDNTAEIYNNSFVAISPEPNGVVAIPSMLGGKIVTDIGDSAFKDCRGMTGVTIPNGVLNIGISAFSGCSGLESVAIPSSVSNISYCAFMGCDKLASAIIPSSVTSVGWKAFHDCNDLLYDTSIPGVQMVDGWVVGAMGPIDEEMDLTGARNIGSRAFYNCTSLTSVTIPDNVVAIGDGAFSGCSGLARVVIPNSVSRIGEGAFECCTALMSITLPQCVCDEMSGFSRFFPSSCDAVTNIVVADGVTHIAWRAFYGCSALVSVTIPDSVTGIGDSAFGSCKNLTRVNIADISKWCSISFGSFGDWSDWSTNPFDTPYCLYLDDSIVAELVIPDSVRYLRRYAFYNCVGLESVVISDSVETIEKHAFGNCSRLTRIIIPDSVTSIGDDAFNGCDGLTDVSLPANFTGVWTFGNCTNVVRLVAPCVPHGIGSEKLSSIVIPDGVTNIADSAFYGCGSLTNVIIADSVKRIGDLAFGGCSSLADVNIPGSVEEIGGHAFAGCSSLTNVIIGAGVANISDRAFADCASLKTIFVPDNVESIGTGAFSGCSSLTNIVIPFVGSCRGNESRFGHDGEDLFGWIFGWSSYDGGNEVEQFYDVGQSRTYWIPASLRCVEITDEKQIGTGAFHNCSGLTSVIIPEGVTSLGAWSFENCSGLRTMIVPNSVRTNDGAFSGCMLDKIIMPGHIIIGDVSTDVEISEGSTFIEAGAFHGYTRLRSVTIPNTVTNIGYGAFYDCKGITNIVIPTGVRTIDGQAFYDCTGLKSLSIMNPDVQFTGGATFGGCANLADVTLPGWNCGIPFAFGSVTNLVITSGTTSIADSAFRDCSTIRRVTIPDSVTDIGDSAFAGCSAIERLTIPQSVCSEGLQRLFPDAYGHINEIEILDGTGSIGQNAFAGCRGLTSITMPPSIASVGDYAFSGCAGIERVNIDDFSAWLQIRFGIESNPLSVSPQAVLYLNGEPLTVEGTFVVPDDVEAILNGAFRNQTRLTNVVLPDGLTRIGAGAFDGCVSLASINLPDTLTDWGLESLPPAMRNGLSYDENGFMIYNGWLLDYQDKGASSLAVPEGIVGIGAGALAGMYDLETVNLPQSLKYIAEGAFRGDSYLDNLVIPDGVETIGPSAFEDCSWLQTLTLGAGVKSVRERAFAGCTQLSSAVFADGLSEIGAEAFDGCWRMQSVSLPLSTENVASSAFNGCDNLTGVTTPTHGGRMSEWFAPVYSQIRDVTVPEDETEVRASMFEGCGSLRTVQMPDSITNIAARAFYGCSSLPEVRLPESLMAVGDEAFQNCSSLTAAALPENVTSIGVRAFQGCSNLSALTLPRGLESLPDYVFAGCSSLDSFVVPAAVTNLGNYIVSDSTTAIYYLGNAPAYGANVYGNASGSLKSYVILGTKGWDGRPNSRDIPASWNGRDILTWSANQFDVTFDANGGLFFPVVTNTYACEETTYTGYSLPPFVPVRKGMDFDGYWTEPGGGTRVFTSTRVLLTKPHTLYAHWKKGATIKVRFNACGGTVSPAEDDYVAERPYCELPVPVREHFAFEGWWTEASGGGRVEISSEVPKAAHELFAHWAPNRYTIRFHANNGTSATVDQYFTYGDTVTLRANTFSSSGNAFVGWALSEDGPAVYADGKTLADVAAIQDNVIHLYAVWVSTRYTVRFDSHGGVGRMENQTLVKDTAEALDGCAFTRTGYTFAGWAVSTTGGVVYGDGENVVNVYEKTGADIVLYAVWKSIAAEMCEEVFDGVGIVSANDAWDTVVVITNDVSGTVKIPDNVGAVTIDLNGHDIVGDGGPAIRIVKGDAEGDATQLAIVDTSDGEKGQIAGGGESAGIEVSEDAATGVGLDVEEGVGVFNGDGSEQELKPKLIGTGKVTVPKSWKTGQKVTWKATADKGSVFARWEGPLVDSLDLTKNERRNPSLAFAVPEGFETNMVTAVFIPLDDDGLYSLGITQTEFDLKEAVSDVWVTDDSQSYVTATVSGLPTGLKFDAKKMTIAGTPTKSGVYWVQIKAKNASGYQWAENVKMTVSGGGAEAKEPKLTRTVYYPLTVICATEGGTVNGTGVYAEGKKVTIKATPAKGYVFAGWYDESVKSKMENEKLGSAASMSVTVPEMRYVFAKFVTAEEDMDSIELAVDGEKMRLAGDGSPHQTNIWAGVYMEWPVAASALSETKVKVAGLPSGLKFTEKDIMKKGSKTEVEIPANTIYGAPTAASKVDAKNGVVPSDVKVTVTTAGKTTATFVLMITVDPLPDWSVGTFTGFVLGTENGDLGSATMTIAANGKVSGKIALDGTNWTFKADSFSRVEDGPSSEVGSPKSFVAEAVATAGKATRDLVLEVAACDGGCGATALPNAVVEGTFGDGEVKMLRNMWKDKETATAAKETIAQFEGVYTVSVADGEDHGSGYLSLTVGKDGSVKAAGKLADGTSVIATSPLMYDEEAGWFVMLYAAPSAYKGGAFAAAVGFDGDAGCVTLPRGPAQWTSRNPQSTGDYGEGFDREVNLVGSYYSKLDTLRKYYESVRLDLDGVPELGFTFKEMSLNEQGKKVTTSSAATAQAADTLLQPGLTAMVNENGAIVVAKATKPVQDKETKEWSYDGANDGGLTLSFTQATGIFKGSYTFWYDYVSAYDETKAKDNETRAHTSKKVSFEGILVHGEEPKMDGFYLWDATGEYEDPKTGKAKSYKYKQSFPVRLIAE